MGLFGITINWGGNKGAAEKKPETDPGRIDAEIAKDAYVVDGMEWTDDRDDASLRDEYKQMLADPAVKAALFGKLLEVCSLNLTVSPPEDMEDDPQAQDVADFVKYCLSKLAGGPASGLLMKVARPALTYQYSISEIVFKQPTGKGQWGDKITLDCLKSKDVTGDWSFVVDAFKNVKSLVHTTVDGRLEYPPDKFVHYAFMPEFENPRGMSDLRASRRAWFVKRYVGRALAVHLDKGGLMIVGTAGSSDREAVEKQLAAANGRRWMVIPENVKVDIVNLASDVMIRGWNEAVGTYDKQIFLGIQGAFLQSLEGQKTGARNIGEVHQDTSSLFVWYLSYELASVINAQIVPMLVRLNYVDAECPVVSLEAPDKKDMKVLSETLRNLSSIGFDPSKKFVSETFGIPPASDDADTLARPAPPSPFGGAPGQPKEPGAPKEPAAGPAPAPMMDENGNPMEMAEGRNGNYLTAFLAEWDRARRPR